MVPWSLLVGIAEGEVAAVVVAKTFGGGPWLIALATAGPFYARLFSLLWGVVAVGRPKLRVLSWLIAASALIVASVGFAPQNEWGGWIFVGQMALLQIFLSGVITVRSALWRSNYPHERRGQIIARIQIIRALMSILAMVSAAWIFDRTPEVYRVAYPAAAGATVVALVLLRRMRVRGERRELRSTAMGGNGDASLVAAERLSLASLLHPVTVLKQMVGVLRADRRFRRYCEALMLTGMGNLMIFPVFAAIILQELGMSYLQSIGLLRVIPLLCMLVALLLWAPFFDRVGVVRFRVVHGGCWLSHLVLGTIGTAIILTNPAPGSAALSAVFFFYVASRIVMGVSMGGGALAWYLGHLHFARSAEAEIYMGVHVTLTGLRGLVMPLVGIWLWQHTGLFVWVLAVAFSAAGLAIYAVMAREEQAAANAEG